MRKNFFQNAFSLIPVVHFRKGFSITLLVFLGSLLDLISVASFLPLLLLLINPSALSSSTYATHYIPTSTLADPHQLAMILTAAVIILIVLKTLINSWIAYRKASYAYTVAQDLAAEALNKYLTISYIQFSHTDYTREMNRISNLPLTFANNFIIPVGTIIAEGFLTFCLLSLIALYDYRGLLTDQVLRQRIHGS